jgi:hypothetical protein
MSASSNPEFQLMRPDRWAGKMYVGSWIGTGATSDVTDKATGETIGTVADADAAEARRRRLWRQFPGRWYMPTRRPT